jgi:hypothetical protein
MMAGEVWCSEWGSHSVGKLAFGPDGYLYVPHGMNLNLGPLSVESPFVSTKFIHYFKSKGLVDDNIMIIFDIILCPC